MAIVNQTTIARNNLPIKHSFPDMIKLLFWVLLVAIAAPVYAGKNTKHFDLARPGAEADKKIESAAKDVEKEGVK